MKILVVDDERSIRLSLTVGLKKISANIYSAENGLDALEIYRKNSIDVVILDIKLPDIDGIEVLRQIMQFDENCTVIMMTHLSEVRLAVQAMKLGAHDYFTKPFSIEEIIDVVKSLGSYINEKQAIRPKQVILNEYIGKSKAILDIHHKISKLSKIQFNTSIMIQGESGTGKEMIAKQIHQKCSKDKPFIAINCAAIPKHLQESELFGHEKGAFSDAKNLRIGLFEASNGGVLFLDEIGDMDLDLQAKLLRVLQEKKFRRIGGNEEIEFNAIIVVATNKNLVSEIEKQNFRRDLYYRLNIIPIDLPPLRERKEDIPLLIDYFINYYNSLLNKSVQTISQEMNALFLRYSWPGNIRELKNIIERLMILNESDVLTAEELPYELSDDYDINNQKLSNLEVSEQEVILKALSKYSWNITKASESLGISRLTLRRKIDKYSIVNKK